MSSSAAAPRIDGAPNTLAHAKALRSAAAAALAKPLALAKKLLSAAAGGWKSTLRMVGGALSVVPTPVKSAVVAAPFATTRGYEWVRETTRKALKMGVKAVDFCLFWGVAAIAIPALHAEQFISKITRGRINTNIVDHVGAAIMNAITSASKLVNKGIDAAFAILGHKTAVRTVTTGATAIAALVAAEGISAAAVSTGFLSSTMSGFVLGTPMLAGLPLLPALLTSTGVVAVSIGVLIIAGGLAAVIFNHADIRDIVAADLDDTIANNPVAEAERVVDAELDEMRQEAVEDFRKAAEDAAKDVSETSAAEALLEEAREDVRNTVAAEAVIRSVKQGRKHRRK